MTHTVQGAPPPLDAGAGAGEHAFYVTVLSNFARGYDKFARAYDNGEALADVQHGQSQFALRDLLRCRQEQRQHEPSANPAGGNAAGQQHPDCACDGQWHAP